MSSRSTLPFEPHTRLAWESAPHVIVSGEGIRVWDSAIKLVCCYRGCIAQSERLKVLPHHGSCHGTTVMAASAYGSGDDGADAG